MQSTGIKRLFLSIDYTEFSKEDSYRAVEAHLGLAGRDEDTIRRFATGDVTQDMKDAITWGAEEGAALFQKSSSVDSFVIDTDGYDMIEDPVYGELPVRTTPIPAAFLAAFA